MSKSKITVTFEQNGKQLVRCDYIVSLGGHLGTIGNVACFDMVRLIDPNDRRRARDYTAETFNGPFTIVTRDAAGKIIGLVAVATAKAVVNHRSGELVA